MLKTYLDKKTKMEVSIEQKIIKKYIDKEKSILTIERELSIPSWRVYKILKNKNVKIRGGKWQSKEGRLNNSKARTKWIKKDFSDDNKEKAYLLGFFVGDLHSRKYRRNIRISCGSTHPSQIKLFEKCFKDYSKILKYSSKNNNTGYENSKYYWSLSTDLNPSFSFLLKNKEEIAKASINLKDNQFLNYIAGFFDAEGSCGINKGRNDNFIFFISMSSKNRKFLEPISNFLDSLDIINHINFDSVRNIYMIKIRSRKEVFNFIEAFYPLIKHNEKRRKFALLKKFKENKKLSEISDKWNFLLTKIDSEVKDCIKSAKYSYTIKKNRYRSK